MWICMSEQLKCSKFLHDNHQVASDRLDSQVTDSPQSIKGLTEYISTTYSSLEITMKIYSTITTWKTKLSYPAS